MFSIIIPTMQKNVKVLNMLLDELISDKYVGEIIIIIDNSLLGINYKSDKIKVITPTQNLYVNPAWNLGVENAKYEFVGILNDDLIFPKNFISSIYNFIINHKKIGYIGLDTIPKAEESCFCEYPYDTRIKMKKVKERPVCWGSAFFFKKSNYTRIPEELKVWYGDDYLFHESIKNNLTNYAISNSNIIHLHSLTSDRKEFDIIKHEDVKYYKKINQEYTCLRHSFLQKIFSIKNKYSNGIKHKIIYILGIKIKFKKSLNKNSQKYYKKVLQKLRKEAKYRKLKVCFLVSETAKWNAQSLYDEMKKSDIFEPFVVVTNLQNLTGRPSYSHLLEFYKSCVDNVQIGWDENTKQGIDLKIFKPDIVFYQQPWELYDNQNVEYVSNFALTCHFSYAMSDAVSCIEAHCHDFYSILYKYFIFSDAEKEEYKNKMKDDCKNVLVLGHPKLDVYKDYKEESFVHKYVIYAPHHSLEENSLNYATFRWNGEYILNWAKQHPEFDWVFKPHPRLKQALIFNNIMSEEDVENYYSEWTKIGLYYNDGNYFDLFKNSKCLITDCGSFLIEYLPTGKPVIHLRNPKGIDYIPTCKVAMESYYKAWNIDDLNKYLDKVLIKNDDYMKNVRIETQKKLKLQDFNSTKKIINFLKENIGENK